MAELTGSTTGTLAAGVAGTVDINLADYSRVTLLIRNTGASNAIGTNALLFSADGTNFATSTGAGTAIGSISTSSGVLVEIANFCAKFLRVSMTSSSGSTYSVEWYAVKAEVRGPTEIRVAGEPVTALSAGALSVTTLAVSSTAAITGAATFGSTVTATGDIAAAGGFKRNVGPFYVTTAASQTDATTKLGDTAGQSWVAPRAGSVTAASAMIDTAVTGAATSVIAKVFKNGSLLNAAYNLSFTQAGAETSAYVAVAKDTYTFAAGDKITVTYTSTGISNTPKLVAFVEVEC